jgi:hypothetical protein
MQRLDGRAGPSPAVGGERVGKAPVRGDPVLAPAERERSARSRAA